MNRTFWLGWALFVIGMIVVQWTEWATVLSIAGGILLGLSVFPKWEGRSK